MTARACSNTATLLPFLNRYGDIEPLGQGQFGLFHSETRHLSRMTMQLNQQTPMLLSSTIRDDNAFLAVDMTNFDTTYFQWREKRSWPAARNDSSLPLQISGSSYLLRTSSLDQLWPAAPASLSSFQFEADFADIFEVRGTKRAKKAIRLSDSLDGDAAILPIVASTMSAEKRASPSRPNLAS